MAEDRIDSIIDTAAISLEIKAVNDDLDALATRLKKYPTLSLGNAQSIRDLTKANQEYQKSLIDLDNTTKKVETTKRQAVATAKQLEAAAKTEAKNTADLSNYYKQLGLAIKDAQQRYYNLAGELGRNHPLSQAALKDANDLRNVQKQLAEDTGIYAHSVGNYSTGFTNFALTLRGLRGPTKLLGEALGIGAQEADQFRLIIEHASQGIAAYFRSKESKAAAETADAAATTESAAANTAYTTTVNSASAATDTFVLNTEAATVAQEGETAAIIETTLASKILRGALLATGIGLIIAGIGYLIYKYLELSDASKKAAAVQKIINQVNEDAADGYGKEAASLAILKNSIEDTNRPMAERLKAVQDIRKEYPEYLKGLSDEQLLAGQVAGAYDLITESLIKNARARAAEAELDKVEAEKFKIQLKDLQDIQDTQQRIRDAAVVRKTGPVGTGGDAFEKTTEFQRAQINKARAERKKANDQEIADLDEKEKVLLGLTVAGIDKKDKVEKEGAAHAIADLIKRQSSDFEVYKKYQQLKVEILKDGLTEEGIYYTDRIKILDKYIQAEGELLIEEGKNQIEAAKIEAARNKANLEKDKVGKDPAQVARINENIAILEENLNQKILDINAATDVALARLGRERVKDYKKIMDDQEKINQAFHQQEVDYEQWTQDQINKIRKKQKEIDDADEEKKKAAVKKAKEDIKDAEIKLAQETQDAIFTIIQNSIQRQIDAENSKSDTVDKNKQKQIDDVNQLGLSQEETTKRLAAIEKQAAFDHERIELRKQDLQIKAARFQKLQAAASTIENTATAVTKALADTPYPYNLVLAGLVGALGAVELGVILATPLPKYQEGTKGGTTKKGFGVAGEVGRELVEDNGKFWLTAATPTLYDFKGTERITPANLTQDILNASAMQSISRMNPNTPVKENDINTLLMGDMLKELRAANRRGTPQIHNHGAIETTVWYDKHFKH